MALWYPLRLWQLKRLVRSEKKTSCFCNIDSIGKQEITIKTWGVDVGGLGDIYAAVTPFFNIPKPDDESVLLRL